MPLARARLSVYLSALLITLQTVCGQPSPGTLTGTVLDTSGKAIPNAAVTVRDEATGAIVRVATDAAGRFSAVGLPAGSFTVEAAATGFATTSRTGVPLSSTGAEDLAITLKVAEVSTAVTVEATASLAAQLAPSGNTLDATSAKTEISGQFIQNFIPPVSDFAEVLNMAPGTFGVNPNGVGLGQAKTFFRGFKDGQYTMAYDGIPFQDTNDPTHHSWAFFPAQWIGGVDFERSPGTASSVGPTNYGGSINLLSRELASSPDIRASASYGSFNTRLLDLSLDSGQFGGRGQNSSLFVDLHQLLSDGY